MELHPGQVFADDFVVERELGRGGMGAVYVAEQRSTAKRRALKVMMPGLLTDAKAAERFLQEAKVGARVESEHVVEVIAAGVARDSRDRPVPWLAMELLDGQSLAEAVDRGGPIAAPRTEEILRQLCHGLGAAHRAGLVHRDVKPDNVFLARAQSAGADLKVKLLDFGIAKVLEPTVGEQGSSTAPMGTPLFMAPEQTRAGKVDPRADVWALGLLAYYMLTGRHYWKSANDETVPLTALLVEISVDAIVPPSERAREQGVRVPDGFDGWFLRCVDRDLERRYRDAHAAFSGLAGTLTGEALADTLDSGNLERLRAAMPEPAPPKPAPIPEVQEPSPAPAPAPAPAPTPAPAPAPASASRLVIVAGVVMLAVGGGALGYSMRGGDAVEPAPSTTVTPSAPDAAMAPIEPRPDAGPPAPAAAPDAGAPAPAEEATDEPARPPPLSATDRRARDEFIEAARLGCRSWAANQPGQRARIRIRLFIDAQGNIERWQVTPNAAGPCLANRAGYVRTWEATGRRRQIRFGFLVAPQFR